MTLCTDMFVDLMTLCTYMFVDLMTLCTDMFVDLMTLCTYLNGDLMTLSTYLYGDLMAVSKKSCTPWLPTVPYLMSDCRARSWTLYTCWPDDLMVRKAARLAVYDWTMIRAPTHHAPATTRAAKRETSCKDDRYIHKVLVLRNESLRKRVFRIMKGLHLGPIHKPV